jgi:hypothetical protein
MDPIGNERITRSRLDSDAIQTRYNVKGTGDDTRHRTPLITDLRGSVRQDFASLLRGAATRSIA